MKRYLNKATAATFVAAVAVLLGLGSCKGRTMENMEPTGETVEVVIGQEDQVVTPGDSITEATVAQRDTVL